MPVLGFCLMAWGMIRARPVAGMDRSDPEAVARAFLSAFAERDAEMMAGLMLPHEREMWEALIAERAANQTWDEIFGDWRWTMARGWDGEFGTARTWAGDAGDYVALPFGRRENGEWGVLMLLEDGEGWYVDDIEARDDDELASWPEAAL